MFKLNDEVVYVGNGENDVPIRLRNNVGIIEGPYSPEDDDYYVVFEDEDSGEREGWYICSNNLRKNTWPESEVG